jgi:hypothetical protein
MRWVTTVVPPYSIASLDYPPPTVLKRPLRQGRDVSWGELPDRRGPQFVARRSVSDYFGLARRSRSWPPRSAGQAW